jgi:divalent metal cation (Fe/Co/Zn/Cd) transporter
MTQIAKIAPACGDGCCAVSRSVGAAPPPDAARAGLIRQAFRLEWFTIGWMIVEAVVALASGIAAGSLVLVAFGLDSVIELMSAGVLVWRLSVELRRGRAFSEDAERIASRIGGVLLFALAAYVVVAAGFDLWRQHAEDFSWPGLAVTVLAIPVMRWLAVRKLDIASRLGSRALRADAMEAITCGWLSFVAVVSLAAQALLGFWWIDSVGSLAIVWLLVKEGREAWAGEDCGCE